MSKNTPRQYSALADIKEEDTGVATLNMDPHVRAKLFPAVVPKTDPSSSKSLIAVKGSIFYYYNNNCLFFYFSWFRAASVYSRTSR